MSKFELKDAAIIVTGASRGIGPHIAAALADRGARIALVARNQPELAAVTRKLRDAGAVILGVPADVTSSKNRHRIVATVEREFGSVDVLVNNAGGDPQREFRHLSEDDVGAVLELNLTSAVILSRLVLPGMLARERDISSMSRRWLDAFRSRRPRPMARPRTV